MSYKIWYLASIMLYKNGATKGCPKKIARLKTPLFKTSITFFRDNKMIKIRLLC